MNRQQSKGVFISRIDEEKQVGVVLKDWIEDAFAGHVKVFTSDDPRDLPSGKRWLDVIEKELREPSTLMLVSILSPASIGRPWMLMEFGGAWIRGIPVLPFCHSGLKTSTLPRPLGDFQGCSIDQPNVGELILDGVSKATGAQFAKRFPFDQMRAELVKAVGGVKPGADTSNAIVLPGAESKAEMHEEEIQILEFLAQTKDSREDPYVYANALAARVGLKRSVSDMRLSSLQKKRYVDTQINMVDGVSYAISDAGVDILLSLGKLK